MPAAEEVVSDARLTWIDDADLLAFGIQPWTELPLWIPESDENFGGMPVKQTADKRLAPASPFGRLNRPSPIRWLGIGWGTPPRRLQSAFSRSTEQREAGPVGWTPLTLWRPMSATTDHQPTPVTGCSRKIVRRRTRISAPRQGKL